jgi:hypothetical protein
VQIFASMCSYIRKIPAHTYPSGQHTAHSALNTCK